MEDIKMKDKRFFKIIAIAVSLIIMLALVFVRTIKAQNYVTVAADHDLDVESDYKYFSMEYLATTYFEIKFDIKAVKDGSTEDVEIILAADNDAGDYEVKDDDTFFYYLGDDAYSSNMTSYDEIGLDDDGDIDMPSFTALFFLAKIDDPSSDWVDYTWAGSKIEKITVYLVAGSTSLTDILKIKEYKFEDSPGGDDHDDSQDFSDYDSLSEADWDTLGGAPAIDISDDTLYLRSSYLAPYEDFDGDGSFYYDDCDDTDPNTYPGALEICDGKDNDCDGVIPANEVDKDGDGFMICGGDCNDNDTTVYQGASGTYEGKDNNCNGIIDHNEKRRFSYTLDTRLFPLWMHSQQLGILPFLPPYPDYPAIQKQMWYPYQLTLSQQQSVKTKSYFFHPALFTWLLNLNYYPFYSPFLPFNTGAQYDINFSQYLNSIIYNPFVFEYHPVNQTIQTITLLSIEIEASDTIITIGETAQLTVTGYYSDGSIIDLTNDAGTIYVSSNQDVVEVENDGKVTAVEEGEATITVTNSGITDQIIIEAEEIPDEIPIIKGHWAGTWEAWLTDPNEGVVTDPNGQIIITMSGDIRFHITEQSSAGGAVLGTIEITGWNVDPQPQDWPGDWTGESDEVALTGWIDMATRYLKARYFYYPGKEAFGDYDENEDPIDIIGLYTWQFNSNKIKITDAGISGQFLIRGASNYEVVGVFGASLVLPELSVVSFTAPNQANPGEAVGHLLDLVAGNQGDCDADRFNVGIYISDDPIITTDDRLLMGGRESVNSLSAGQTHNVHLYPGMGIPTSISPGNYYIGALLDEFDAIEETDKNNNYESHSISIGGA
jgi:hypothetical protein